MYQFSLICVGTLKEQYWSEAAAEYVKRLAPFARVKMAEIPEIPFSKSSDAPRVQRSEGERLLARLPKDFLVIALDSKGKHLTSEELSVAVQDMGEGGTPLAFLIGGPLGLSDEVRSKAHLILSLSSLTLPHQLARIVLLEQIYRAMTIVHYKTYHY